jgi:hypothetical protein
MIVDLLGQLGVELLVVGAVDGEGPEQAVDRADLEPRHLEHVLRRPPHSTGVSNDTGRCIPRQQSSSSVRVQTHQMCECLQGAVNRALDYAVRPG